MTADATHRRAASDDAWTIQRILDWTIPHLQENGSETARLDAEILLAHARQCNRIELYTHFDTVLTDDERAIMRELVKRRASSEPVAYLVGHREFFSLDFAVTPDVLIPRPDTETWVMETLERAKAYESPRILDIGTGSGCIAIATAVNNGHARITATDVAVSALEIARKNAETHDVAGRIEFLQGDLFEPFSSDDSFDFVVSNPPYVTEQEMAALAPDVRCHEPHQALVAGPDGLSVLKRLIEKTHTFLVPQGNLLLEIGEQQGPSVQRLLEATGEYGDIAILKDLGGKSRVICATRVPSALSNWN